MSYIGSAPAGDAGLFRNFSETFSGNGSNTQFTLGYRVNKAADIEVIVNNVQQNPSDGSYTVSNYTTLVFSEAPSSNTNNIFVYYRTFSKPSVSGEFTNASFATSNSTLQLETSSNTFDVVLPTSNSTVKGLSFVVDQVNNTSITVSASANSVKSAYDLAANAVANAATAYTNAASYADAKAANAYSNAASYADAKAANAYSNAASYADTKAGDAYSNAASYADAKAANAYSNAASYADAKAANAYSNVFLGGTFTGQVTHQANLTANNVSLTGNMQVDGNLTVSGNTVSINVTNLSVEDNMIYLNANNTVSNPDLGFSGNYNDGTYRHAGLFRDATDGVWKFFHQYEPEPDASAYIDTSNNTFALANVQANTFIGAGSFSLVTVAGNTTVGLSVGNSTVNTVITSASINTNGTLTANTISVGNVEQTQTNLQVDPAGTAFLNALIYG